MTVQHKLTPYDPAHTLVDEDEIAFFIEDALSTNDAGYIAHALGIVARARGMSEVAEKTGLARENLYRSLSNKGNPTLKTTIATLNALGYQFGITAINR